MTIKILLTNDDGIDAPGLEALAVAAACLGGEAVVVAPAEPHSGCGHRVTTGRPLRVDELAPGRFCVHGTPADCVRLALARLAPDIGLVLAGINAGGNLGADIHHSGTVAAAREAALHGRVAVAASHYHRRVNLPDVPIDAPPPAVVECRIDPSPFALGYRLADGGWHYDASYHERPRVAGGDVDICFSGGIAVSRLRVV